MYIDRNEYPGYRYLDYIQGIEENLFPEFESAEYIVHKGTYYYYAPTHHFRSGLINEKDVADFSTNGEKTLLSVGSGPAYLERLLVKLGVPIKNITLTDINTQNCPGDFQIKKMDMYASWSILDKKQYDLIIYPESVTLNHYFNHKESLIEKNLSHLFIQSMEHLTMNGTIRINGHQQKPELIKRAASQFSGITLNQTKDLIEIITDRQS